MIKKAVWIIVIIVFIIVIIPLAIRRFSPTTKLPNIPIINKITCFYPLKVSGNSMSPALPVNTTVNFNRCFDNKDNLPIGTIMLH